MFLRCSNVLCYLAHGDRHRPSHLDETADVLERQDSYLSETEILLLGLLCAPWSELPPEPQDSYLTKTEILLLGLLCAPWPAPAPELPDHSPETVDASPLECPDSTLAPSVSLDKACCGTRSSTALTSPPSFFWAWLEPLFMGSTSSSPPGSTSHDKHE